MVILEKLTPVEYLEKEFNYHWDKDGMNHPNYIHDAYVNSFFLRPYTGDVYINPMMEFKEDDYDYTLVEVVPMSPIPSIPSTVKEWEKNTGHIFGKNYNDFE